MPKVASSPTWYRRRSAVFAFIYAVGFLGGWGISFARHGRYVAAFANLGSHWGNRGIATAAAIASLCMLGAFALRVWGSSYLSAQTVWDEHAHTDALIVAGPFRYVRHPLYLGNIILGIGLGAGAPLFGWIFIVLADAAFVGALVRYEEAGLERRHRQAFDEYRAAVPSLLPRLAPVPAQQTVRPSFAQGLRAESFTGFILLGMVGLFSVPSYGWVVFLACYLAGVIVQLRIERR
ncbi:MAG TPA: isoprenylcysteine carboxylmethyltransferase family protein [Candidatus Baltobacteraceae bacterium]